jgi:hypothetical protein
MSDTERKQRRAAVVAAYGRGEDGDAYWRSQPQLNTVGYLTTVAGALAASYAIGWITGRFYSPFTRLQMNLVQPLFDITDVDNVPREECTCRRVRGWADQARADALITAPTHRRPVRRL